jgi:hypothetical protein
VPAGEVIRAEIVDGAYRIADITAASLRHLCAQLLAAGYDPDASVECYRPGRTEWDIRARSIRAAPLEARTGEEGEAPSPVVPPSRTNAPAVPPRPNPGMPKSRPRSIGPPT